MTKLKEFTIDSFPVAAAKVGAVATDAVSMAMANHVHHGGRDSSRF